MYISEISSLFIQIRKHDTFYQRYKYVPVNYLHQENFKAMHQTSYGALSEFNRELSSQNPKFYRLRARYLYWLQSIGYLCLSYDTFILCDKILITYIDLAKANYNSLCGEYLK